MQLVVGIVAANAPISTNQFKKIFVYIRVICGNSNLIRKSSKELFLKKNEKDSIVFLYCNKCISYGAKERIY